MATMICSILGVVAIIGMAFTWKSRGVVLGGLVSGLLIGMFVATIKSLMGGGFQPAVVGKALIIGTLFGVLAVVLPGILNKGKSI